MQVTDEFYTDNGRYSVRSFGNGWAYEITDNSTGNILWFQDSHAEQLQRDTDNFDDTHVLDQHFECIDG
jgi:hypothetical protein